MESRSARSASERAPFDVVALVASAGGLEAIARVLRDLPEDVPAAIVVAQHLGPQGSMLANILRRQSSFTVRRIEDGDRIEPGHVHVAPARKKVELLPDGTFALHPNERGAIEKPLDFFLESLADSLGPRAMVVVLTGMGNDAAAGALALRNAGGAVLAQSEDTAEQPSMPRNAAANGAAALVLPLHEIGKTIGQVLAGGRFPTPRNEIEAVEALFDGPGAARATLRAIDWAANPLGPVMNWSPGRRTIVRAALGTEFPMVVFLGSEFVQIGNDAFAPSLGEKALQGLPARTTWREIWDFVGPQFERIERTGAPIYAEDALFEPNRRGFVEEAYFTYCYSPLYDEGEFAGILSAQLETTERVLAERRLATLRALTGGGADKAASEACEGAVGTLADNPRDVPFALMYLVAGDARADLCASVGLDPGHAAAPRSIALQGGHPVWPLGKARSEDRPVLLDDLRTRLPGFRAGPWPEPPRAAYLVPLRTPAEDAPVGVLVLGVSPRLTFDAKYRDFLELVGARVAATLTDAQARQKERERIQKLAALNEAKTAFFSNVSHEFRTPLTLMLGPLEELAHRGDELPSPLADEVATAARNARRLLSLVNTLLDFSQLEEGKIRPRRAPTDLAALTADVASLFRSATERAGLRLLVDCPPLSESVSVDPTMWEKVVSNLLSNALKFTFEGEIAVGLRQLAHHVELTVRDTGVGIPAHEVPNLFKRFHRIRGTRARAHEGSGIGLALVQDLVRLHFGRIRVQSREGEGTTFTVWVPLGGRTFDEAVASPTREPSTAAALAEIASHWDVSKGALPEGILDEALELPLPIHASGARVLVVDDNADMRVYLRRLLSPHWSVETAGDGAEALGRLREGAFDLVLADVMMPNLDGFELLRRIRGDEARRTLPVILLTARAGEEAAIEGLLAGADDYLVKPFSARELIARVGAQIELARVRGRAQELSEFLVRFSDAVQGLSDPHAVAQAACRLVAERLGVERAYWAEVDWATREFVIGGAFHAPGTAVVQGRFPVDAWEPFTSSHLAGRPVVVDDTQTDPRVPPEVRAGYAQIAVGADLAVPVTSGGKLVCTLAVNQRLPRRWTPEEVALVESVASRCWPEVERARAEAALRASEERQTFLLELSDALRPLRDPAEIKAAATRLLGERLRASRAFYAEAQGDAWQVAEGYWNGAEPLREGLYPMATYGSWIIDDFRRGERLIVRDMATDERFHPSERSAQLAIGIAAAAAVALVKNGDMIAMLALHTAGPRDWTEAEVALVEETAERTWAAVERARAETALRESEARLRVLVASLPGSAAFIFDPELRYLLASGEALAAAGVAPEDLIGKSVFEAMPPELSAQYAPKIQGALAGEAFEHEHASHGRSFVSRGAPLRNAAGAIYAALVVSYDITDRKRAEQTLRESEERQAFLLELSDALRACSDGESIKEVAVRMLGERLRLDRCYVSEVFEERGYSTVGPEHLRPGISSMVGRYRLSDYPETMRQLSTQPLMIHDADNDPRFSDAQKAMLALVPQRALLVAPLRRGSQEVVWALAGAMATPRRWTESERTLLQEVAERTWTAVERARVEAALRASEQQQNDRTLHKTGDGDPAPSA